MLLSNPQVTSEESIREPHSVVFFLIFLLLVIQLLWFVKGPIPLMEGGIVDSDGYMHLNRVLYLMETGDWYSSFYPRSNAPYGDYQHWTRVIDVLLIGGASLAALFVPFATALHWWGVLLSPVMQILSVVFLIWMVKPIFDREHQLLAGGVFLLQPALMNSFLAGRPDHHSVLMAIFILLLALTLRIMMQPLRARLCVAAGVLAGIAIWTSVESLIAVSVSLSILALGWVWYGGSWGTRNLLLTSTLSGVTFLTLLVERGIGQFYQTEYDRFSYVHWGILSLITCFWIVIWLCKNMKYAGSTPIQRLGIGVSGMAVVLCVQWVLFPKFFQGPLVDVDPQIMTLLWSRVAETQPLIPSGSWQFGRLILYLGIALPTLPYLMWLIWSESNEVHRLFWCMIGLGVLVYFPLAFHEIRWVPYAELLILLPYTHLIGRMLQRFVVFFNAPWHEVLKMSLVLVSAMWFLLVGAKMLETEQSGITGTMPKHCPIIPLSQYLNDPTGWGSREQTILAFVDFGPELLYRTSHRVIMTPYHRNTDGILDAYRILSDPTGHTAKSLLNKRKVDLIVTCPSSPTEPSFFQAPNGAESFYDRLDHGHVPQWLHEVTLPSPLTGSFKVFQVRSEQNESA